MLHFTVERLFAVKTIFVKVGLVAFPERKSRPEFVSLRGLSGDATRHKRINLFRRPRPPISEG